MKQFFLAVDQLLNTMIWSSYEKSFGYADELISARLWRLNDKSKAWEFAQRFIDGLFLFLGEENHCYNSWISELQRHQLPPAYQEFLDQFEKR